MDHFEVFGLPRRLRIDGAELQRKFYELSRRYHPDFHQAAPAERQAEVLDASARLNAAYRALRDPISRIEYLVRLEEGRETNEGATVKPKAPPELLEEMFEIQEALQEAKASNRSDGLEPGARETLAAQRDRLLARYRDEEARLRGPLSEGWDAGGSAERSRVLGGFKDALATRAYLRTVIDDIDQALGEAGEGHVSHRRH
ncbi:MAG: Fe-S protein assembly co-chaperone HscB [Candidatus Rokuibacteriota bacterium]|nr:MAG: Fe-S protein assembly co-chaperone HscB [Candidatus Rokubacteria bacterium]PYN77374.1 MAG: Fe-S protein assembly co-chaperone HscB [Candidatus Rokubacteria bacterium]